MSNREHDSAAELAAFVDGRLAGRPDAPTPNVEPQDLAASKALLVLAGELQPDPRFSSKLARELRQEHRAHGARRPFWSMIAPSGRLMARALVLVVALVLITGGAALLRRTGGDDPVDVVPSVSAAEVLAEMAVTAKDPEANGLHSYQATSYYHGIFTDTVILEGETFVLHHTMDEGGTVWVRTPDKVRTEETRTIGSSGQSATVPMQSVLNKDSWWLYWPEGHLGRFVPSGEIEQTAPRAEKRDVLASRAQPYYVPLFGGDTLEEVILEASADYEVTMLDPDTVAGRATYVLLLVPRPESSKVESQLKLWVDQEFYLILKQEGSGEGHGPGGNSSVFTYQRGYSQIAFNVPLDGVDFSFTPPAGVEVVDFEQIVGSMAYWEEAAKQLSFTILEPSDLPPGVKGVEPRTQVFRRKPQAYRYSYNLDETSRLSIFQTSAKAPNLTGSDCAVEICREGSGETVDINGVPGVYGVNGEIAWLRFERDGTYVEISLAGAAQDDGLREKLLEIARSMEPVKK